MGGEDSSGSGRNDNLKKHQNERLCKRWTKPCSGKLYVEYFSFDWLESIDWVTVSALLMSKGFRGRLARRTKQVFGCWNLNNRTCTSPVSHKLAAGSRSSKKSFFSRLLETLIRQSYNRCLTALFFKICFTDIWHIGWLGTLVLLSAVMPSLSWHYQRPALPLLYNYNHSQH